MLILPRMMRHRAVRYGMRSTRYSANLAFRAAKESGRPLRFAIHERDGVVVVASMGTGKRFTPAHERLR